MRQRQRLGEIIVEVQRARQGAGDLRDLDRVGEARAVMVALVGYEDLCLVGETPEGGGMDDAVAVALEFGAGGRRGLREQPPARGPGIGGIGRAERTIGRGGYRLQGGPLSTRIEGAVARTYILAGSQGKRHGFS